MEEFVAAQKDLLKEEHQAEIDECLTLHKSLPLSELQNRGICLKKVHIISVKTGLYGRIVAKLGLRGAHDRSLPSNRFSSGDIVDVHLKTTSDFTQPEIQGVVLTVKDASISIAVDGEGSQAKINELYSGDASLTLIKTANEVTYKRLQKGLDRLLRHTGPAANLTEIIFGNAQPARYSGSIETIEYHNSDLNQSQKDAVAFSLSQRDLAVIHGPPGTGKTTTVAEVITQFIRNKQKVLACAPSNVAIDNILEKLSGITVDRRDGKKSGIKTIRIGHPARILTPALQRLSLDAVIAKSDSAAIVQDVRKDIDELHSRFRKRHNKAERAKMRDEKKLLTKELREREKKAITEILSSADVVLATNVGAHSEGPLKHLPFDHFDVVVIDECGQALEASCWIPILNAPKVILAGDHLQLPPTVKSRSAAEKGLSVTLLERVVSSRKDVVKMLDTQYRMNADIMNWSSCELYDSKLKAHCSVAGHTLNQLDNVDDNETTATRLLYIDTAGCDMPELQTADSESIGNEGEANIVAQHVEFLIKSGVGPSEIAVISPYNMQVDMLRKLLKERYGGLEIRSVDGFQGREKEAVVISMVRSNERGVVGFLSDVRRMNVAVTRARRHLTVVGNSDTVGRHKFLKSLIDYMSENGEIKTAHDYLEVEYRSQPKHFEKHKKTNDGLRKSEDRHDLEEAKKRFGKVIDDFLKREKAGGPKFYDFPKTLFGYERLAVHELCEEMGLRHASAGEDKNRRIRIGTEDLKLSDAEMIIGTLPTSQISLDQSDANAPNKSDDKRVTLCLTAKVIEDAEHLDTVANTETASEISVNHTTTDVNVTEIDRVKSQVSSDGDAHVEEAMRPAADAELKSKACVCDICGREIPASNVGLHKIHCQRLEAMKKKLQSQPIAKVKQRKKKPRNQSREKKGKDRQRDRREETDEELLERAIVANKSCSIGGCEKFVSVLGRNCPFCKRLFCLEHHLPELHGCGDAARLAARRQIGRDRAVYPGSGTPSKKLPPEKHAALQRKLDQRLRVMENGRKVADKKKK